MLLSMSQVQRLQSLRIPVAGPQGRPRAAELESVLAGTKERLEAVAVTDGIVPAGSALGLHSADIVLRPSGDGRRLWIGSWLPSRLLTELDGGPRDGSTMALPSLRSLIEFRQLAPSWAAAAAAGYALPKVSYRYQLAGYETARGMYVHRYLENQDLRRA